MGESLVGHPVYTQVGEMSKKGALMERVNTETVQYYLRKRFTRVRKYN